MVRVRIVIKRSDPDPYQIEKLDPDPSQSGKQDPDPYQKGLDRNTGLDLVFLLVVPPSSTSCIGSQISPPSHQLDTVRNNT